MDASDDVEPVVFSHELHPAEELAALRATMSDLHSADETLPQGMFEPADDLLRRLKASHPGDDPTEG